jgi:hypothetical protein
VGYVNVPVQGGNKLTLISNPLKPTDGNYNITNTIVLPDEADGANIYQWGGSSWSTSIPNFIAGFGWSPDTTIKLGEAFFIQSPVATTVTFVGEVSTGTNVSTFPTGLSINANKVPVAENIPGRTVGNDGDVIYTWGGNGWDAASFGFIEGFGWSNGGAAGDSLDGPMIPVGGGFVYQNTGAPVTWTRVFNP